MKILNYEMNDNGILLTKRIGESKYLSPVQIFLVRIINSLYECNKEKQHDLYILRLKLEEDCSKVFEIIEKEYKLSYFDMLSVFEI